MGTPRKNVSSEMNTCPEPYKCQNYVQGKKRKTRGEDPQ